MSTSENTTSSSDEGFERYHVDGEVNMDGLTFTAITRRETLDKINDGHFKLRDTDVILVSYPKSGSTWLQYILHLLQHPDDINDTGELATRTDITCPFLESSPPHAARSNLELLESKSHDAVRLMKTHLYHRHLSRALEGSQARVILMMRHPKDTLVSYYHFYKMNAKLGLFKGTWDYFFEMFRHNNLCFGDWFDFTLGWWKNRSTCNILCLRYEDMKKDVAAEIVKVAKFLNVNLSDDKISDIARLASFDEMKTNPNANLSQVKIFKTDISPFFRKGEVGDWRNYFSEEQNRIFEEIYTAKMAGSGLDYSDGLHATEA